MTLAQPTHSGRPTASAGTTMAVSGLWRTMLQLRADIQANDLLLLLTHMSTLPSLEQCPCQPPISFCHHHSLELGLCAPRCNDYPRFLRHLWHLVWWPSHSPKRQAPMLAHRCGQCCLVHPCIHPMPARHGEGRLRWRRVGCGCSGLPGWRGFLLIASRICTLTRHPILTLQRPTPSKVAGGVATPLNSIGIQVGNASSTTQTFSQGHGRPSSIRPHGVRMQLLYIQWGVTTSTEPCYWSRNTIMASITLVADVNAREIFAVC